MNLKSVLISFLFQSLVVQTVYTQEISLQANLGHAGSVTAVEFSPDGSIYATASTDHSIKIWESETCREIKTLKGHTTGILAVSFSPDGNKLVSSDEDDLIVWDIKTGAILLKIDDESSSTIEFISDKNYLTGSVFLNKFNVNKETNDDKYFFSQEKGMINGFVRKIAVSCDGKFAAIGDNSNVVHIIKVLTGKKHTDLKGHSSDKIKALDFNHDGTLLATAGHGPIKLWDTKTFKEVRSLRGHSDIVNDLVFSPDGKMIASVSDDGKLILWDIEKGKALFKKTEHKSKMLSVDISPDGTMIITGGEDKKIRVWDVSTGNEIMNVGDRDIINYVSFSMYDERVIAQSKDMSLKIWQADNTDLYTAFNLNTSEDLLYGFDKEGKHVFSYENLWSVDSSKTVIDLEDFSPEDESIIKFSKDNKYFYLEETFGIKKTDKITGEVIAEVEAGVGDKATAISPDDEYLLCSEDNEFGLYSIKTGKLKQLFKGHTDEILCLAFNSTGDKVASGSSDRNIKIWDTNEAFETQNLSGHKGEITCLAFSPAKNILVSGSSDNTIKFWNSETGDLIKSLDEHTGRINYVSFNRTGNLLLSSSDDGSMKLWDAEKKELLATVYCLKSSGDWVAVSPNGKFDGTPEGMKTLHVVKGKDIIPLPSLFEKYYSPKMLSTLLAYDEIPEPEIHLSDIKAPPVIKINRPFNGDVFTENKIEVKISWPDTEDDIQEVLVYHNNKLEKRIYGFKPDSENFLNLTAELEQGENNLKVIALNSQRTESLPQEINIYYDGIKASSDLYLMVIGIDKHKNPEFNLNYAFKDAEAFKDKIESGSQEIFAEVHTNFLYNEKATHEHILNTLDSIKQKAKPEDVFLFYFAGHGATSIDSSAEFFLISHDVTRVYGTDNNLRTKGLSGNELKIFSEKINARKQLFIIDACHSGAIVDVLSRRGFERDKAIAQLARSTGTFWIVASESEQYALELNKLGHGLFTYAVLEGLNGKAEGKSNDKKITVKELNAFINDFVPEFSKELRGTPQYPTGFGYGQDFPLVLIK
jgi:WD40 repeat protein